MSEKRGLIGNSDPYRDSKNSRRMPFDLSEPEVEEPCTGFYERYEPSTPPTSAPLPLQAEPAAEPQAKPDSEFETGAVRSADANMVRFDLLHPIALLAIARTYGEGAIKYGDCNWERGMHTTDLLNHVLRHVYMYLAGDRSEPHLPHAAWGLLAAISSDVLHPELNAPHLRGPGCTLTPEMLARQQAGDAERKAKRAAGEFDHLGDWKVEEIPEVARILVQRQQAGE